MKFQHQSGKNTQIYEIAQSFADHGNMRDALRTLLFIVAIDPKDIYARMYAARILIGMGHITERAQARSILEEGLQPGIGLSVRSVTDLIDIYRRIGPIEKAKVLFEEHRDAILKHYSAEFIENYENELHAELASNVVIADGSSKKRFKRAQYPTKDAFNGSLQDLFLRDVASDFKAETARFSRTEHVLTIGSCFARRIAAEMREQGLNAACHSLAETVNTTFANRDFFNFIAGNEGKNDQFWEEEVNERNKDRAGIKQLAAGNSIVIYTLGVAPAFFSRESGEFTPHTADSFKTRSFLRDNVYRMTTVEENIENLTHIFNVLNSLNPNFRLIITVSPVPLRATFESASAIVSDCESKSTLRVVATQFARMYPERVVYWPSFEMVRWVSPHREPFYGTDDDFSIHISDEVVSTIVKAFLKLCLVD